MGYYPLHVIQSIKTAKNCSAVEAVEWLDHVPQPITINNSLTGSTKDFKQS